MRLPIRDQ